MELLKVIKSFIKEHHRKKVFKKIAVAWTIGSLYDYLLPEVKGSKSEIHAMYSLARDIVDLYKPIYEAECNIAVTPKSLAALNSHFQTPYTNEAACFLPKPEAGYGQPVHMRDLKGESKVTVDHLVYELDKKLKIVDMKKIGPKGLEVLLPKSWIPSEYDEDEF